MGCFAVHREEGEKQAPNERKGLRILGWTFRFIFPKSSKSSSTSGSSESSANVAAIPKLQDLRVFTLAELKVATKNFSLSEKLGEGGFGDVYRGVIKAKEEIVEVAVKKLNIKGQQGHKEWLSEVTYLRMVDHPNLVKLLGYCVEDDERGPQCLLVYEFMPNKSLDDHIFTKHGPVLSWEKRLQVALGTAKGLAYLHEEVKPQIIYRDLKAGNILLDNDFNPKLSDFGLARDGPTVGHTHVTTAVVGTAGYAAPEYVQTGHLTAKSDVWSFGMVLLELLTGRKALDMNRPRNERSLADWIKPYANDKRKFRKVIEPRIKTQLSIEEAQSLMAIAQKCTAKMPKSRPRMSEVVKQLMSIVQREESNSPDERNMSMASVAGISATESDFTTLYESQDSFSGFCSSGNTGQVTSSSDGFSQDIIPANRNEHGEETSIYISEERPEVGKADVEALGGTTSQVEAETRDYKSLDVTQAAEHTGLEREQNFTDTSQGSQRNDVNTDVEQAHEPEDQLENEDKYMNAGKTNDSREEHGQHKVQGLENEHHDTRETEDKLSAECIDRDDPAAKHEDVTPSETAQIEQQAAASEDKNEDEVTGRCLDRNDPEAEKVTPACSLEDSKALEVTRKVEL